MDKMKQEVRKAGRPKATDPKCHRYNFKLTEAQNIRFCQMLWRAGCEKNRSRFIVKRIFAEEFRIVKTDPSMGRYITLLCNLVGQFARVGNNYNQIVKAVNTHLSRNTLPGQIDTLVTYTSELKALSERVIALTEQLRQEWLHE